MKGRREGKEWFREGARDGRTGRKTSEEMKGKRALIQEGAREGRFREKIREGKSKEGGISEEAINERARRKISKVKERIGRKERFEV